MSGHTPGPWYVEAFSATYRVIAAANHSTERLAALGARDLLQFEALSVGTKNGQVAIVPLDESSRENARLIAAAPDLLAALRAFVEKHDGERWLLGTEFEALLPAMRTAIAKALREPP